MTNNRARTYHIQETLTVVRFPGRRELSLRQSAGIARALGFDPVSVELGTDQIGSADATTALLESVAPIGSPFIVGAPDTSQEPGNPPTIETLYTTLRALVAVEGDGRVSPGLRSVMNLLVDHGCDVAIVHVFTDETLPRFWSPGHHEEAWRREFLMRYCGGLLVRLHLRSGVPPDQIGQTAADEAADFVVVEWNQTVAPGHSRTMRALLTTMPVPLLVVPATWRPAQGRRTRLTA